MTDDATLNRIVWATRLALYPSYQKPIGDVFGAKLGNQEYDAVMSPLSPCSDAEGEEKWEAHQEAHEANCVAQTPRPLRNLDRLNSTVNMKVFNRAKPFQEFRRGPFQQLWNRADFDEIFGAESCFQWDLACTSWGVWHTAKDVHVQMVQGPLTSIDQPEVSGSPAQLPRDVVVAFMQLNFPSEVLNALEQLAGGAGLPLGWHVVQLVQQRVKKHASLLNSFGDAFGCGVQIWDDVAKGVLRWCVFRYVFQEHNPAYIRHELSQRG